MSIIESILLTDDVTLISLNECPADIVFLSGLFDIISKAEINVDMISQTPAKGGLIDVSFTVSSEQLASVLAKISEIRSLGQNLKIDVLNGNSKISLFGEAMRNNCGVATEVFKVAKEAGVNIILITTSEVDISLLVENSNAQNLLKSLKSHFNK